MDSAYKKLVDDVYSELETTKELLADSNKQLADSNKKISQLVDRLATYERNAQDDEVGVQAACKLENRRLKDGVWYYNGDGDDVY